MRRHYKILILLFVSSALIAGGGLYFGGQGLFGRDAHDHGLSLAEAEKVQYTCGMHPFIIVDEPGLCPICNMELTPLKSATGGASAKPASERKVKYWVAPMDATYIRNEPGKSPMGMDLVPVYEDESKGGAVIRIDPVTAQNMGVRTSQVERRDLSRDIRTVGLVGYEEPRQYLINSKNAGWVEKLHVASTGEQVKKGQALLELYSPDLVSAQEEYLLALNNSAALKKSFFPEITAGAERLLAASRQRLVFWDISEKQIQALEKEGKVQKTLRLYSKYSGIVTAKMVSEGMFVKPGMDLFQLSDISKVWVYADIYEYELPWVKVGQTAEVELPFAGGRSIAGRISTVYPYVEPKTRTVKARIDLQNPDFELRPEMYVNVKLKSQSLQNVLTVPAEAILRSGEKQTVFVALGEGKFEPRQVQTGLQGQDGRIEIRQGLLDRELVVTSAQFLFDSESKLREAIQKMLELQKTEPSVEPVAGQTPKPDALFDGKAMQKKELDDLFK